VLRSTWAIAEETHTEGRRTLGRRLGAAAGAQSNDVPAAATQEAGEKTSNAVCFATEIASRLTHEGSPAAGGVSGHATGFLSR
jgi:hypothetical protein